MIKIRIVAVGKVKEKYFQDAINEYSKRLSRYCEFSLIELKEENYNDINEAKKNKILEIEGERIEWQMKGYCMALTIEGNKLSSEKFADKIKKLYSEGIGEITFIIGGSYGLTQKIKNSVNEQISFSDLTFPHTLFRVMLSEQIYRAFTIISGTEYHK